MGTAGKYVALAGGLAILATWTTGCSGSADTGDAEAAGELVRDCVVPLPAPVVSISAPVSLEYPDGSLWVFESASLADGTEVRGVAALVRSAEAACTGELALGTDDTGLPRPRLSLAESELEQNASRTDGRRLALAPRGGFVHGGRGYLYYDHLLLGPGFWDVEETGTGLCVFETPGGDCTRLADGSGETRLWPARVLPVRSAFVAGEDAYLAVCRKAAAFVEPCLLARVPAPRAAEPEAYTWFNAFSGWIEDPWNGTALFDHVGPVTLGRNDFHEGITAVLLDPFEGHVSARLAPEPTGPYEDPVRLFSALPPESFFVSGGVEHAALRDGGGRTVHVSYGTNNPTAPGLHLASFRFDEALRR
jgi:hypothetical protein